MTELQQWNPTDSPTRVALDHRWERHMSSTPLSKRLMGIEGGLVVLAHRQMEVRVKLASLLRHDGFRVVALRDSGELLDWLAEQSLLRGLQPALILAELADLPFGGLQIAASLRSAGWATPVVLLSRKPAKLGAQVVERIPNVAVFYWPFDWDDIRTTVALLIARQRLPVTVAGPRSRAA